VEVHAKRKSRGLAAKERIRHAVSKKEQVVQKKKKRTKNEYQGKRALEKSGSVKGTDTKKIPKASYGPQGLGPCTKGKCGTGKESNWE